MADAVMEHKLANAACTQAREAPAQSGEAPPLSGDDDRNQMPTRAPMPTWPGGLRGLRSWQLEMKSSASRAFWLIGSLFEAIGETSQGFGHGAHGSDRLLAHLRNDCVIHISDGMAQLHLDQFNSFFDATAYAARAWWRICAHINFFHRQLSAVGPCSV
jgi:hypothetical protein